VPGRTTSCRRDRAGRSCAPRRPRAARRRRSGTTGSVPWAPIRERRIRPSIAK
jgi:hypothetical protein